LFASSFSTKCLSFIGKRILAEVPINEKAFLLKPSWRLAVHRSLRKKRQRSSIQLFSQLGLHAASLHATSVLSALNCLFMEMLVTPTSPRNAASSHLASYFIHVDIAGESFGVALEFRRPGSKRCSVALCLVLLIWRSCGVSN